jgi:hypothetical protein
MSNRPKTEGNLASTVELLIREADKARSAHLAEAMEEEAVKEEALRMESARLRGKYGDKSPRVEEIDARLEAQTLLRAELRAEFQRSQIVAPRAGPETAVIYGRIVDSSDLGIAGLVVEAMVAEQRAAAASQTDETGFYSFTLPARESVQVLLEVKDKKRTIYRDKVARNARPGVSSYSEIVVDPKA